MSKQKYADLKRKGRAPREICDGGMIIITAADETAWDREHSRPRTAEARLLERGRDAMRPRAPLARPALLRGRQRSKAAVMLKPPPDSFDTPECAAFEARGFSVSDGVARIDGVTVEAVGHGHYHFLLTIKLPSGAKVTAFCRSRESSETMRPTICSPRSNACER